MRVEHARLSKNDTADTTRTGLGLSILALLAASVLVRLVGLDHLPRNDELYTALAASGWLAEGVPRIADGIYDRAQLYTILVAHFFDAFGTSLVVARLPSVIAGSLLVVAVFVWTRAVAGGLPAWIAALFLCLSPLSIQLSQYARFYTLHALLFWLGAVGIYALAERRHNLRTALPLAAGSALCLALAFHLQALTIIGLIGISAWLGLFVLLPWLWSQRSHPRRLWLFVAGGVILVLLGALLLIESGIAGQLWSRFREVPLHASPRRDQVWFYQLALIERYPVLWPLFPFLALAAIAACPRPAAFSCLTFMAAFGALSLAATKHFNYIFFALPFLFVVWGVSLATVIAVLWRWIVTVTDRAVARLAPALPPRPTRWALITAGMVFLVVSNGAPARTILKPFGIALQSDETSIDWAPARAALQPWLEQAAIVLTSNDMHALYYLGDYDVAVNPSRLSEVEGGVEFSLDPRTGRPVIGTASSLRLIMSCYPTGVLVADATNHPPPWIGSEALAKAIRLEMSPIALPGLPGLFALRWDRSGAAPPAECASLNDQVAARPSLD
jgi:4-amino-4-deoxy-L-arabinose transferase-like glycosyltransferase